MRTLTYVLAAFACLVTTTLQAAEAPFGQERVPTREFRTPQRLKGHSHRAHGDHGHDQVQRGHRDEKAGHRRRNHGSANAHRHEHGGADRSGIRHHKPRGGGGGAALRGHTHEAAHGHGDDQHSANQHDQPGHAHAENQNDHEVETENLFGFTLGSDTEEAGAKGVAVETIGRLGKRGGSYRGLGQKLEFSFGATNDVSFSVAALGDYHRLRNIPGFEDVPGRYAFNGIGGELRWRLLDRKAAPFGLTLHLEPSVARIDEVSGQAGRKIGSENKLILDRELIPDTLFGAINVLYDVERMRERHANFVAERAANAGLGAALSHRVTENLFLGAEARYLRAYEGFGLRKWHGEALLVGPTLFARLPTNGWISASWNVQLAGRTAINRAERAEVTSEFNEAFAAAIDAGEPPPPVPDFGGRGRKDLVNFERHQFRLKVGFEF